MQPLNPKIKKHFLIVIYLFSTQISYAQNDNNTQVIPVSAKKLSEVLINRELQVPAETASVNTSQLSSEIVGNVDEVFTDVGEQFKQGDVLLKLDSTDYELAYQLLQTNLTSNAARIKQAELRLKRANDLNENNYIAADDLLARQTDLSVLKAEKSSLKINLKQAQRNIDKTIIIAPYDGVVLERYANIGSYVAPGMALMNVIQSENVEIYADVPSHLASTLNQANQIYFQSNNNKYPVELINLSPVVLKGTRTQKARLSFKNQQAAIGSSGELVWVVADGLLPADLVVNRNRQLGLFTLQNNKAVFVPLPNAQEGRPVAINLETNTTIIVGGRDRLQDGDSVKLK